MTSHKRLLASSAFLVSITSLIGAELGKPDMASEEFKRRFTASYGILSDREPSISEVESVLLGKLAAMMSDSPALGQNMLESMLAEGKPVSAAFNQILGNIHYTNQQWAKAEIEFRSAIRKHPDFQRAWNSLGTLKMQQGQHAEGATALARAIELGASDSQTHGMLGYALLQTQEYISAEIAYNMALLRSPGNVKWLEGKARILAESGRHLETLAAVEELLKKDPANLEYWRLEANAHLALGDLKETARSIEIARMLGKVDANELYLLGNIYIKEGMHESALGAYLTAINLHPEVPPGTIVSVVRTLLAQNEVELARRLMATVQDQSATWQPHDRVRHALLEGQLAQIDANHDAAAKALERALELDPLNAEGLFRLSQVYAASEQKDKARYCLERIAGDSTYEYGAQLFLSKLLIEEGRFSESLDPLGKALRLKPSAEVQNLYDRVRVALESGS